MFVIIHFKRIMLNCEMFKLKSIQCLILAATYFNISILTLDMLTLPNVVFAYVC